VVFRNNVVDYNWGPGMLVRTVLSNLRANTHLTRQTQEHRSGPIGY
jgi:hypothetical protein